MIAWLAAVAHAQTASTAERQGEDVVISPLSRHQRRKKEIPVVLEWRMIKPYDLPGSNVQGADHRDRRSRRRCWATTSTCREGEVGQREHQRRGRDRQDGDRASSLSAASSARFRAPTRRNGVGSRALCRSGAARLPEGHGPGSAAAPSRRARRRRRSGQLSAEREHSGCRGRQRDNPKAERRPSGEFDATPVVQPVGSKR